MRSMQIAASSVNAWELSWEENRRDVILNDSVSCGLLRFRPNVVLIAR